MCIPYHIVTMFYVIEITTRGWKRFERTCKENNVVNLLTLFCSFFYEYDQNNDKIYAVLNSIRALFANYQKSDMTNDD